MVWGRRSSRLEGPGPGRDSGLLDAGDLARPHGIGRALLEGIDAVDKLVLAAIDREVNIAVGDYDIDLALRLMTLKLVGYTEVVHTLRSGLAPDAAIVIFGGLAMLRPYLCSTTVSTVNGGVIGLMHTLIVELAPVPGQHDPSRHRWRRPVLARPRPEPRGRADPVRAAGPDGGHRGRGGVPAA